VAHRKRTLCVRASVLHYSRLGQLDAQEAETFAGEYWLLETPRAMASRQAMSRAARIRTGWAYSFATGVGSAGTGLQWSRVTLIRLQKSSARRSFGERLSSGDDEADRLVVSFPAWAMAATG